MDSRNLVTSIVICNMPEAYGRAEYSLSLRLRGTPARERGIQNEFEYLVLDQSFRYSNVERCSLALWAAEDPTIPTFVDINRNLTSWSTSGITYRWHTSPDVIVVWSIHA